METFFRPPVFFIVTVLSFCTLVASGQGMAINTTGASANASAILDVSSTTQGVLVPRMLAAQRMAIASPANGLTVYQTDAPSGLYYYNSGVWTPASQHFIPMASISQVDLTTTTTGATDSVAVVGLGAGTNQLVNINGGSYIDPSNTFPAADVTVPISGTVTSFFFSFRVTTTEFLVLSGTYTMQAQLYYYSPPAYSLIGSETFYPVTGATVSLNLNTASGGILVGSETLLGSVTGLSFSLTAGSRLLILVDYNVSTSPFELQTLSGYVTGSVGMQ